VPTEKPDTSPEPSLTNYQDNIEVLPQLSHDNSSEDEYESDDQGSESDDLLANKLAEQILHKKLKERGINIPKKKTKQLYGQKQEKPKCEASL